MFWTDVNQAAERLQGCIVNYDGHPTLIEQVTTDRENNPICVASRLGQSRSTISLDDKKWNNFRDLPKLGWFNYVDEPTSKIIPLYSERRAMNTRRHGLNSENTKFYKTSPQGLERDRYGDPSAYFANAGYLETAASDEAFPKLSEVLMSLGDEPSGVAFSRKFCVLVTEEGMKWLLRKNRRVGFFTGTDSLNLFPKLGFYREELLNVPTFDINNIREF